MVKVVVPLVPKPHTSLSLNLQLLQLCFRLLSHGPGQQQIQGPPQQQGQQQQAQTIRHTLDDALSQAGRPVRAALRLSQAPPPQQGQRLLPYLEQHQEAEVFRELSDIQHSLLSENTERTVWWNSLMPTQSLETLSKAL